MPHLLLTALVSVSFSFGFSCQLANAEDEVEIALIDDNDFQRGFVVWSPKPGMKRETGKLAPLANQGEPVWGLAQWHSRFDLAQSNISPGLMRYAHEAKSVEFDFSDPAGGTITLGLEGMTEYDGKAPERGAAWPHLLVERQLLAHPSLTEIASVPFRFSYRLIQEEWHRPEGWDAERHTAQFVFYITVQNQNPQSAGFRDFLWFGVPIYDTRYRHNPQRAAIDFSTKHKKGTGKFIFRPDSNHFTDQSAQDGRWITIDVDLLPLMKEALTKAWELGYLTDSRDMQDYHLGSMNFGWEVPGTMNVAMQVKGLSLWATR
ncbi:hypothetical protein [Bythopirellula polymerisocia]|uniref:Hydroxyneurosporene synthase (CrtC) n=1 Tax=Bythopirellula polymerisocia TaxID=2528003 RepID=A0A5C6D2S5_9BACT|nr:hypothetical protein [Bythopirellula polymerisocia]TWU30081.1 hypothetical protein Pla144_08670 [Bythopirellula polymerisocia]